MSKKTNQPRPEPVPVTTVCSVCGETWALHREENGEVSTLECVRLLQERVRRAEASRTTILPYVQPYRVWPYSPPQWTYTVSGTPSNQAVGGTPRIAMASST